MKELFAFLVLVLILVGCSSSGLSGVTGGTPPMDMSGGGFPVGTYLNCAEGVHSPDGKDFLNSAGFQATGSLTLTQSGSAVNVAYVDQNGLTQTLGFLATTGEAAALAQPAQVTGLIGICVTGPGSEQPFPAIMNATSGALTYGGGAVFVSLTGELQVDAGTCGRQMAPGSWWVLCQDRREGAAPSVDAAAVPFTGWPAGQYACDAQVETATRVNGMNQFLAGGGSGTLTLAVDGAKVTVAYSGDPAIAGSLHLVGTSATTAKPEPAQTLAALCPGAQTPSTLPVGAASLSLSDSTLFVSFAGTLGGASSCAGAQLAGSILCGK